MRDRIMLVYTYAQSQLIVRQLCYLDLRVSLGSFNVNSFLIHEHFLLQSWLEVFSPCYRILDSLMYVVVHSTLIGIFIQVLIKQRISIEKALPTSSLHLPFVLSYCPSPMCASPTWSTLKRRPNNGIRVRSPCSLKP